MDKGIIIVVLLLLCFHHTVYYVDGRPLWWCLGRRCTATKCYTTIKLCRKAIVSTVNNKKINVIAKIMTVRKKINHE